MWPARLLQIAVRRVKNIMQKRLYRTTYMHSKCKHVIAMTQEYRPRRSSMTQHTDSERNEKDKNFKHEAT